MEKNFGLYFFQVMIQSPWPKNEQRCDNSSRGFEYLLFQTIHVTPRIIVTPQIVATPWDVDYTATV